MRRGTALAASLIRINMGVARSDFSDIPVNTDDFDFLARRMVTFSNLIEPRGRVEVERGFYQ